MTRSSPPPDSFEELIRARTDAHPDETWLFCGGNEYTWRDVLSAAQRVANGLLDLGVRPGDRVALMMANRPEFFWAYLALQFLGGVAVPVNIFQRGKTLEHILGNSGASVVVADADLCEYAFAIRDTAPHLSRVVAVAGEPKSGRPDATFEELLEGADVPPDVPEGTPAGSSIYYTSGTTGPPKGILTVDPDHTLAGGHPLGILRHLLQASGIRPGETMYTALPLCHGNALIVSGLGSMTLDAKVALADRFSASSFLDDCRRFDAVCFNTLGGMVNILLAQPPSPRDRDHNVRVVLSAGTPPASWKPFEERFGVRLIEYYGMMDSPGITMNADGPDGSIGKPVPGMEYRIVDDDDRELGAGEVGEIVFRHPQGRMTEYIGLPEETDRAYRNGWFHSGDLGMRDENGWFYYRGRKKLSIRRLGRNISAWEIEAVVEQHPGVAQAAAHAVPSEIGEDEVKLVVVPAPGHRVSPQELREFCEGKMAYYAIPRFVEIVTELPKTPTERVAYDVLRRRGVTPATWDARAPR